MDSTEDKSQEKTMAKLKRASDNKAGNDSTDTDKSEKTISKKYLNHRRITQDQVHKVKQNGQRNKTVKKEHYNYPVQIISNCENIIQNT